MESRKKLLEASKQDGQIDVDIFAIDGHLAEALWKLSFNTSSAEGEAEAYVK